MCHNMEPTDIYRSAAENIHDERPHSVVRRWRGYDATQFPPG